MSPPGAYRPLEDRHGRFDALCASLPRGPALAIADARVLRLHPHVGRALRVKGVQLVSLAAGEGAKSLARVEFIARAAAALPRTATVLAIGGGTIGDLATVFAHVFKRGVGRFIHVPTTALAAVDSSVGGKGGVNVGGVKNALGVFHCADEGWLCPELFTTLSDAQWREGWFEAWKMAATLDAKIFARWQRRAPDDATRIREARRLKDAVVRKDPYETKGVRVVLNFGHTFGHVLETVTRFRVRHGEAVGLGMLCALDVGRALGVTPDDVARSVESAVFGRSLAPARRRLSMALRGVTAARGATVLAADKKSSAGEVRMVLLEAPGRWTTAVVPAKVWQRVLVVWKTGERP